VLANTSRFVVPLPNNSSTDIYPNNMVSQFTMKLSQPIELKGSWEDRPMEAMFPSMVVNVFGGRFHYKLRMKDNRHIKCILNSGVNNSITMLIVQMRHAYHRA